MKFEDVLRLTEEWYFYEDSYRDGRRFYYPDAIEVEVIEDEINREESETPKQLGPISGSE